MPHIQSLNKIIVVVKILHSILISLFGKLALCFTLPKGINPSVLHKRVHNATNPIYDIMFTFFVSIR